MRGETTARGAGPSVVLSAFVAGVGPVPPTFSFELSGDEGATWTTVGTGTTGAPDRQYAAVTPAGSSPLRLRFTRTGGTGGLQLIAAYVDATGGEPEPPPGGMRRAQPMLGIWMPAPGIGAGYTTCDPSLPAAPAPATSGHSS